ncbi:hypothetical protein AG1IA_09229 [Rhizoctonia solani AG-1 IA]|uniref:Phospholipase A2 domain-containing protein n=1 Tax=Thanatephorus cucumeris (strain AG1-IA) TaxID=983506 RepID=L8WJ28_THACA|nr:hypothetical protein AG1IA_09229 [Rhizoctonia solani AG-1 IA]
MDSITPIPPNLAISTMKLSLTSVIITLLASQATALWCCCRGTDSSSRACCTHVMKQSTFYTPRCGWIFGQTCDVGPDEENAINYKECCRDHDEFPGHVSCSVRGHHMPSRECAFLVQFITQTRTQGGTPGLHPEHKYIHKETRRVKHERGAHRVEEATQQEEEGRHGGVGEEVMRDCANAILH